MASGVWRWWGVSRAQFNNALKVTRVDSSFFRFFDSVSAAEDATAA